VTIKKCGHVFGHYCLERWMYENNTCPVCRVVFFAIPDAVTEDLRETTRVQHYALGVYTMGNSRLEISINSGEQARESLDVGIDVGARESLDREEGTRAGSSARQYFF
jgi:hypothetical protein